MTKRKQQRKNNGIRYTDKAKSVAVETVRAAGGRITDQVLKDVQLVINAPNLSLSTLDGWWKKAQQKTEAPTPTEASRNLVLYDFDPTTDAITMWTQTRDNYLKAANRNYQLATTDGKDAVAAAERAQKMIQLLQGMPTEIIGAMPVLNRAAEVLTKDGVSLGDALEIWLNEYIAEKARLAAEQIQNSTNFQGDNG